jgi:sugar lactone lactonase YvrE
MQKLLPPNGMAPIKALSRWLPLFLGFVAPLAAQVNYATPYTFQVVAGTPGVPGSADGTGAAARFTHPYGMAIDSSGNIYIADKNNDVIRKMTPAGVVTTIAGLAGTTGFVDGTGSAAEFNRPNDVAVDKSGNLWVADTGNDTIRKITPAGVVTTPLGTAGSASSTDGTGSAALFSGPAGICVDATGTDLYIADTGNSIIRKVVISTLLSTTYMGTAGTLGYLDGTGAGAEFNNPIGITIDSGGNLYIADTNNNVIRKVTSSAVSSTLAGSSTASGFTDGTGVFALFNSPRGVAVDSAGNVYVTDSANSTIRMINPTGVVTTLAGTPGDFANVPGTGASALFDEPIGIVVNSGGTLFVSTELGYTISQGTAATALVPAILQQPTSQSVSSGTTVSFHVLANGLPAPTYQWYLNGTALANGGAVSGVTGGTLVISGATAANAGSYTAQATNASGTVTSSGASLTVAAGGAMSRLANISCRSQVGLGTGFLILGFEVGGAGTTGSEPLLIRASGPALATFDVTGFLPDPQLQFYSGPNLVASNFGWAGNTQISSEAATLAAFPWTAPASLDSALLETVPVGGYTAQVNGQSGDQGVALAEIYDATPPGTATATSPRLINVSARSAVSTGGGVMIVGFVIEGSSAKTVLIRASGPALSPYLTGFLPDPELELYNSSNVDIGENYGWAGDPEIAAEAASVAAFPWTSTTSSDSALLVTLAPGSYTAQVAGASGDSGIALLEVYEIK